MFTPVSPEKAVEIENAFRQAKSIGEFVDAVTSATDAMYDQPDTNPVHAALRTLSAEINAALVKALGGRGFPLRQIPDVMLFIDNHAEMTTTVLSLLERQIELQATAN